MEAYLTGVLAFPALSPHQKTTLLEAGVNGSPPFAAAFMAEAQSTSNHGRGKSIALFVNMVSNSSILSSDQKIRLLSGMDAEGTHILTQLDNQIARRADEMARSETSYSEHYLDVLRTSCGESRMRYVDLIVSASGLTLDEKRSLLEAGGPEATARPPVS